MTEGKKIDLVTAEGDNPALHGMLRELERAGTDDDELFVSGVMQKVNALINEWNWMGNPAIIRVAASILIVFILTIACHYTYVFSAYASHLELTLFSQPQFELGQKAKMQVVVRNGLSDLAMSNCSVEILLRDHLGREEIVDIVVTDSDGLAEITTALNANELGTYTIVARLAGENKAVVEKIVQIVRSEINIIEKNIPVFNNEFVGTKEKLIVELFPESGDLVRGVENRVYVVTRYPNGSPAQTSVNIVGQSVSTDKFGLGSFVMNVATNEHWVYVKLSAEDAMGCRITKEIELPVDTSYAGGLLLRTNKVICEAGQGIKLSVYTINLDKRIFINVLRNSSSILMQSLQVAENQTDLTIQLDPELLGTVQVQIYQVLNDGSVCRDTQLLTINPPGSVYTENSNDFKMHLRQEQAVILTPAEKLFTSSIYEYEETITGYRNFISSFSILIPLVVSLGTGLLVLTFCTQKLFQSSSVYEPFFQGNYSNLDDLEQLLARSTKYDHLVTVGMAIAGLMTYLLLHCTKMSMWGIILFLAVSGVIQGLYGSSLVSDWKVKNKLDIVQAFPGLNRLISLLLVSKSMIQVSVLMTSLTVFYLGDDAYMLALFGVLSLMFLLTLQIVAVRVIFSRLRTDMSRTQCITQVFRDLSRNSFAVLCVLIAVSSVLVDRSLESSLGEGKYMAKQSVDKTHHKSLVQYRLHLYLA